MQFKNINIVCKWMTKMKINNFDICFNDRTRTEILKKYFHCIHNSVAKCLTRHIELIINNAYLQSSYVARQIITMQSMAITCRNFLAL